MLPLFLLTYSTVQLNANLVCIQLAMFPWSGEIIWLAGWIDWISTVHCNWAIQLKDMPSRPTNLHTLPAGLQSSPCGELLQLVNTFINFQLPTEPCTIVWLKSSTFSPINDYSVTWEASQLNCSVFYNHFWFDLIFFFLSYLFRWHWMVCVGWG